MGRIMAIDFGSKRVGVAVTDPLAMIAGGLTTVPSGEIFEFLEGYFKKEAVDCVVVGDPKGLDGKPTDGTKYADQFVREFTRTFPTIRVERMDERFTSAIAKRSLIESGVKKGDRRNKALIDEVSATLILQSYLEKIK